MPGDMPRCSGYLLAVNPEGAARAVPCQRNVQATIAKCRHWPNKFYLIAGPRGIEETNVHLKLMVGVSEHPNPWTPRLQFRRRLRQ